MNLVTIKIKLIWKTSLTGRTQKDLGLFSLNPWKTQCFQNRGASLKWIKSLHCSG